MEPVNIPVEIDSPHQVLLWSVDEFAPLMLFLVPGNFLNQFFLTQVYQDNENKEAISTC